MATPALAPLLFLPWYPTLEELRSWMRGIGFADYSEDLAAANFNADDIRAFTSKTLMQALALPNLGRALEFEWALRMSDVRCEELQRIDAGRTALSRLNEFQVAELFESLQLPHVGALFLHHHVTGKGVEILDLIDLKDMGFVDAKDIRAVLQVRRPTGRSCGHPRAEPLVFDGGCSDPAPSTTYHAPAPASSSDDPVASSCPNITTNDDEAVEHSCLMRIVARVGRSVVWSGAGGEAGVGSCSITGNDGAAGGRYTYITHLIQQPVPVNDCVPCSSSSCLRSRPISGRRVFVVGVLGPSGVGKSSLCWRLAHATKSPFQPLQSDWYVRPAACLPPCTHYATAPHLQWDQRVCYELPSSYDLNGLHDELVRLIRHVAHCKPAEFHPYCVKPPLARWQGQLWKTGEGTEAGPIWLFVEGFVLFAEPSLVALMDELVWLDVPWKISAKRRYQRGNGRVNYETFCSEYRDHMCVAHDSYRQLMESNVQHRYVHKINAAADAEEVFHEVLTALERRCYRFQ